MGTKDKTSDVKAAEARVGKLLVHLRQKGVPVRLLAALLNTQSYETVYKRLIGHDPELEDTGGRRGVPNCEKKALEDLRQRWPALVEAIIQRGTTERKWCTMNGFLKEIDGKNVGADLDAIVDPEWFMSWNREDPIALLKYDFHEAFDPAELDFDASEFPRAARVDYDKIRKEKCVTMRDGRKLWIYLCPELGVKVRSYNSRGGKGVFRGLAREEVYFRRLKMFAELEYPTREDIEKILAWRPRPIDVQKKVKDRENRAASEKLEKELREIEQEKQLKREIDKVGDDLRNSREQMKTLIDYLNRKRADLGYTSPHYPSGFR